MSFIDVEFLKRLINPPRCAGCGERMSVFSNNRTQALCQNCRVKWERLKSRACAKCGRASVECTCTVRNLKNVRVLSLVKFGVDSSADRFIYALKNRRNEIFFDFAIDELYRRLCKEEMIRLDDFSGAIFTNVPRNQKTISSLGFDHAEIMAKGVAEKMDAEYKILLYRRFGGKAQKNLGVKKRSENVDGRFIFNEKHNIAGKTVVLVDDVITTGATVSECVRALREGGVKEIILLSLARTQSTAKKGGK